MLLRLFGFDLSYGSSAKVCGYTGMFERVKMRGNLRHWLNCMFFSSPAERRRRAGKRIQTEPLESRLLLAAEFNLVRDINLKLNPVGSKPSQLTTVGSTVYFVATSENHGTELWRSNGTSGGTVLAKDILPSNGNSSPDKRINVNGTL
jgi:ELWxxDGT repeat protein